MGGSRFAMMRLVLFCFAVALVSVDAVNPTDDQLKGAYFGALVADALTLGSHYEYDATKIKQAYGGDITKFLAPGEMMGGETHGVGWGQRNYHPGTVAGDQTDYGEYNVLVLEYLAQKSAPNQPFAVEEFLPIWSERLQNGWKQWVCTQTRRAFQVHSQGGSIDELGGHSNAMALRFAAAFAYYDTENAVVDAALKSQFTHAESTARAGCEFFAKVTYRVLHGKPVQAAVEEVASESGAFIQSKVKQALDKVAEATEPNKVGKASPTEGTLPGALYFILKYDNLKKAAVANAMVGGDNASRSIGIGMVLGAKEGTAGIPAEWKSTLNHWKTSEGLLDGILAKKK